MSSKAYRDRMKCAMDRAYRLASTCLFAPMQKTLSPSIDCVETPAAEADWEVLETVSDPEDLSCDDLGLESHRTSKQMVN